MDLKELGDLIVVTSNAGFKSKTFNHSRFEPDHMFKPMSKFELSYSTVGQFKECMLKFAAKKFVDLNFFKTNEALFLGNLVHKFAEDLINDYMSGNMDFDNFNSIAKSHYESVLTRFDKNEHANDLVMVESLFKYVMGRKKFNPDIFFDDLSFISTIPRKRSNYVEKNKFLFQNAAKLLKQLFNVANQIGAKEFIPEGWIRFPIKDTPVTFIGKLDLHFPFNHKGEKYIGIVDFKTGKKEYFSWDQLHYYALYWGKEQFSRVAKYFFDLKEGNRILYKDVVDYDVVYGSLKDSCNKISDLYSVFDAERDGLKEKYEKKLNGILRKADPNEIHKTPCELVMMVLDILNKDFFKAKGVADYHSNGGFSCTYCDILSYCPIRA